MMMLHQMKWLADDWVQGGAVYWKGKVGDANIFQTMPPSMNTQWCTRHICTSLGTGGWTAFIAWRAAERWDGMKRMELQLRLPLGPLLHLVSGVTVRGKLLFDSLGEGWNKWNRLIDLSKCHHLVSFQDTRLKIRIHGHRMKGTIVQSDIVASNGMIHIINMLMDGVSASVESRTGVRDINISVCTLEIMLHFIQGLSYKNTEIYSFCAVKSGFHRRRVKSNALKDILKLLYSFLHFLSSQTFNWPNLMFLTTFYILQTKLNGSVWPPTAKTDYILSTWPPGATQLMLSKSFRS